MKIITATASIIVFMSLSPACSAEWSEESSVCDSAAELDVAHYTEHQHDSDETMMQKTGRPRIYYQAVLDPELTSEQIEAVKRDSGLAASVMASLSLSGNSKRLSTLVNSGISANTVSEQGAPLIVIAAGCGRVQVVNILIKLGADIYAHDPQHVDAMAIAITEDNDEIVNTLVEKGYIIDRKKASGRITERLALKLHKGKYSYIK